MIFSCSRDSRLPLVKSPVACCLLLRSGLSHHKTDSVTPGGAASATVSTVHHGVGVDTAVEITTVCVWVFPIHPPARDL